MVSSRTDAEAEAPILWPPDAKSWFIGKDSDAGKDWGQEERGWQRKRWLDDTIDSMDMSLSKLREVVKGREARRAAVHGVAKSLIRLSNWTDLKTCSTSFPEYRVHHSCIVNSLQGILKIGSCSSTWSNPCRGRWQVPMASAHLRLTGDRV